MNKPPLFPHSQSREMDLGQPELPFPLEKIQRRQHLAHRLKAIRRNDLHRFYDNSLCFRADRRIDFRGFRKGRAARSIDSVGIVPVNRLYIVAPKE